MLWLHFIQQAVSAVMMLVSIKLVEAERSWRIACGGAEGPGLRVPYITSVPISWTMYVSVMWSLPPKAKAGKCSPARCLGRRETEFAEEVALCQMKSYQDY